MGIQSLTSEQLLALLGAAKAHSERDWLMILVAVNHGLRATEVVEIVKDDMQDGMLDVHRLKGSLRTLHPLIASANPLLNEKDALFAFARNLGGKQRLFPVTRQTFWNIVQRHATSCNLPKRLRHPHTLKHTTAMQSIGIAGVEMVRQYLGHKSGSSTLEYLKVSDEQAAASVQRALKG